VSRREFVLLEDQVRRSLLFHVIDALAVSWSAAWTHATVAKWIRGACVGFATLPSVTRVRASAVFVATFAAAQAVAQRLVPAQVAPAVPLVVSLVVVALAIAAALAARRLSSAWETSTIRDWLRLAA